MAKQSKMNRFLEEDLDQLAYEWGAEGVGQPGASSFRKQPEGHISVYRRGADYRQRFEVVSNTKK